MYIKPLAIGTIMSIIFGSVFVFIRNTFYLTHTVKFYVSGPGGGVVEGPYYQIYGTMWTEMQTFLFIIVCIVIPFVIAFNIPFYKNQRKAYAENKKEVRIGHSNDKKMSIYAEIKATVKKGSVWWFDGPEEDFDRWFEEDFWPQHEFYARPGPRGLGHGWKTGADLDKQMEHPEWVQLYDIEGDKRCAQEWAWQAEDIRRKYDKRQAEIKQEVSLIAEGRIEEAEMLRNSRAMRDEQERHNRAMERQAAAQAIMIEAQAKAQEQAARDARVAASVAEGQRRSAKRQYNSNLTQAFVRRSIGDDTMADYFETQAKRNLGDLL